MLPRASGAFEKTIGGDWYDGFSTIEMKNEESRGFFFFLVFDKANDQQ